MRRTECPFLVERPDEKCNLVRLVIAISSVLALLAEHPGRLLPKELQFGVKQRAPLG